MADDEWNGDSSNSGKTSPSSMNNAPGNNLNAFANDGSFMEMFKRKMESKESKKEDEPTEVCSNRSEDSSSSPKLVQRKPALLASVGKRRGGKVLPTGMVKKIRTDQEQEQKNDAWSQYMAEVKKYKERSCEDEGKTRPLVK